MNSFPSPFKLKKNSFGSKTGTLALNGSFTPYLAGYTSMRGFKTNFFFNCIRAHLVKKT
jgi:hypothetical protein